MLRVKTAANSKYLEDMRRELTNEMRKSRQQTGARRTQAAHEKKSYDDKIKHLQADFAEKEAKLRKQIETLKKDKPQFSCTQQKARTDRMS